MKNVFLFSILILFVTTSCNKKVSSTSDYEKYLVIENNSSVEGLESDLAFWNNKYQQQPNQFPYLAKMASINAALFEQTGSISNLKQSQLLFEKVNAATNHKNAGYLRSLSTIYIKQHEFKKAEQVLTKAEKVGENLDSTRKMLFDVYLELGNYFLAEQYLNWIKKENDFDYLIRYAKWQDKNGNLDMAIKNLEKAKVIAESSNLKHLKIWTYTNLADFYGHAGNIEQSYKLYLKALDIEPHNAYAKKGIVWILYSHENNPKEALRILDAIAENHKSPDYHLLKAEIAESLKDETLKQQALDAYFQEMNNVSYGAMYNKYNALLFADELQKNGEALEIAEKEINERPTPESYDLLAWSYYKNGDVKEALKIVEEHVVDNTFEPTILYHIAEVYKANGQYEKVKPLKAELLASLYELGPNMKEPIEKL